MLIVDVVSRAGMGSRRARHFVSASLAIVLSCVATAGAAQTPTRPSMTMPSLTPLAKPKFNNEIFLYPDRVAKGPDEQWETYLGGPIVRNVINPTIVPMLPAPGMANGAAIVYAPGGGFQYIGMNDPEIQRLRDAGVTVFLLKYRTQPVPRDPNLYLTGLFKFLFDRVGQMKQPGAWNEKPLHAYPQALEDGLAAMRHVRTHAAQWHIDPKRIGIMGGSAGAMTAIDVAYTRDDLARPDFVVAMIPPKSVDDVPATAPPLFVAASVDDPLFPGSEENIVAQWARAGRPVEAHFYERGGHGLAKETTAAHWFEGCLAWMRQHALLPPAK